MVVLGCNEMPCYWPLRAYEGSVKDNGKVNIVWRRSSSQRAEEIFLPCGKCIGCRLNYSQNWAVRCMHEASLYEDNSFITLTYSDENLPRDGSLNVSHWQDFMKRLRKSVNHRISYYHCGEYGDRFNRPHLHALLFNHDFKDKILHTVKNGNRLYTSKELERLWPFGFNVIGEVTTESAGYVARYAMKKVVGEDKEKEDEMGLKPYERFNSETGEVTKVHPEYCTMSRRPAIGKKWYEKYKKDLFPRDELVWDGSRRSMPRFYDNLLDKEDPELFNQIKEKRKINSKKMVPMVVDGKTILVNDNDSFRLPVKEKVKLAQIKTLMREVE